MSKNKVVVSLILSLAYIGWAQAQGQVSTGASLKGVAVVDSKPAVGITIMIDGSKKGTTTNNAGIFAFENVAKGKARIHFSGVGITHRTIEVQLAEGAIDLDTIVLTPLYSTMQDVVVSGTMKAVSKMDSPIPVEVYTPVLFKKNPSPNIFESLHNGKWRATATKL